MVTGYFDLGKAGVKTNRSVDQYFANAEYLFKINCNFVFIVERENYHRVWEGRKRHNLLDKTYIMIKELNELKFMDQYDKAKEMVNNAEYNCSHNREKYSDPLYFMVTCNKVYLMEYIIGLNPFSTEYFGWVDFGIKHVIGNQNLMKVFESLPTKVKICEILHIPKRDIVPENYKLIAGKYTSRTVGGFWLGNIVMVNKFVKKAKMWIERFWDTGYLTWDEVIYALVLQTEPFITEKYYGGYWSFIDNWSKIVKYDKLLLKNIKSCRLFKEYPQALDMCEKVMASLWDTFGNTDKWSIYHEIIIASYYVDKEKYDKYCLDFVEFLEGCKDDKQVMDLLKSILDTITFNVSFRVPEYGDRVRSLLEKLD